MIRGLSRLNAALSAMKTGAPPVHRIELRLREIEQLFNSMDPTPFHHKDLDPDAEELSGSRFSHCACSLPMPLRRWRPERSSR